MNGGNSGLFGGRMGDIVDEGCLKSMDESEWRRKICDCSYLGGYQKNLSAIMKLLAN